MTTWWVNQGKTFEQEVRGGYMWAPKLQRDGNRLQSYEFMKEVSPGDLVFSYHSQKVMAVGVAKTFASSKDKPGELSEDWNRDGWFIEVDYVLAETPFRPLDDWAVVKALMPATYSPLDKNGRGAQKLYLSKISEELGQFLLSKVSPVQSPDGRSDSGEEDLPELIGGDLAWWELDQRVLNDGSLKQTEKMQLIAARRGQGVFRERVFSFERRCRVTGIQDPRLLVASHIKPWSVSDPYERLDGNNGLMLSPHIDKLFDRGIITFSPGGKLISSKSLSTEVQQRWNVVPGQEVGRFTGLQGLYLEYHHDVVFEGEIR